MPDKQGFMNLVLPLAFDAIKATTPQIVNSIASQRIAAREAAKATAAVIPAKPIKTRKGVLHMNKKKFAVVGGVATIAAVVGGLAWILVRVNDKNNVYEKYMEAEGSEKDDGQTPEKKPELDPAILKAAEERRFRS